MAKVFLLPFLGRGRDLTKCVWKKVHTLGRCKRDARAPTVGARELVRGGRHFHFDMAACLPIIPEDIAGINAKPSRRSGQWSGSLILVIAISASFGFEAQPRRAFTKDSHSQLAQGRS
jgi:hypothetical protein